MEVFSNFIEGPLFIIIFVLFLVGVLSRSVLFAVAMKRNRKCTDIRQTRETGNWYRVFIPLHRILGQQPLRVTGLYLFHLFLVLVPIWLSGHIILWEDSFLGWSWTALPEGWADGMTILLVVLALFFLVRRIALSQVRKHSSVGNYLLPLVVAIPFASGFAIAHGAPDHPVRIIHVLSGELLLLVGVFLFVKSRLDKEKCTGCAACEVECPTGTLKSFEKGSERVFSYDLRQCITCGICINVCPEEAAFLKHDLRLKKFFRVDLRETVRRVTLAKCQGCGELIAPNPQIEKIGKAVQKELITVCNHCKGKEALMKKLKKQDGITEVIVEGNVLRHM